MIFYIINMFATYDNLTYFTDDNIFINSIKNGQSEPYPRELDIIKKYLNIYPECNNTFIDIGGHIGTTSLVYSRLYKNVIAFEPNKKSYDFFVKNIKYNDIENVKVYNKGIFNKKKNCVLVEHKGGNSGCFYIKECEKSDSTIEVVKLDDIDIQSKVDFIKIDTEGSELQVLESSLNIINKYRPLIQVETNFCSNEYFGYGKERIFEFMKQNGYEVFDDDGNNPLFYSKQNS